MSLRTALFGGLLLAACLNAAHAQERLTQADVRRLPANVRALFESPQAGRPTLLVRNRRGLALVVLKDERRLARQPKQLAARIELAAKLLKGEVAVLSGGQLPANPSRPVFGAQQPFDPFNALPYPPGFEFTVYLMDEKGGLRRLPLHQGRLTAQAVHALVDRASR